MDPNTVFGPDDDLPELWVVPLHETPPLTSPKPELPPYDGPAIFSLFDPDDPPSDVGFHPRLKRFGEAA